MKHVVLFFIIASVATLNAEAQPTEESHTVKDPLSKGEISLELVDAIEHDDVHHLRELFSSERDEKTSVSLETRISSEGMTPLMYAACRGCPTSVQALIDLGADVEAFDDFDHLTVLMYSCRCDNQRILEALLNAHADINREDRFERTALVHATLYCHPEAVGLLLDRGSNPNKRDASGMTPLLYSIEYDDLESARKLVDGKADVNQTDATGLPPLFFAVFKQRYEHAKLLVEKGARLDVVDGEGHTLEQFCKLYANDQINELLKVEVDEVHVVEGVEAA